MKYNPIDNNHFVVSYELLQLLEWLMHQEQDALKKIVERAFNHGFVPQTLHKDHEHESDHIKQNVVDFFTLLEILMSETMQEKEAQTVVAHNLLPALDHIDSRQYDPESIAASIAKAQGALRRKTTKNAHDILYKELLKRWRPAKNSALN